MRLDTASIAVPSKNSVWKFDVISVPVEDLIVVRIPAIGGLDEELSWREWSGTPGYGDTRRYEGEEG